MSHVEKPTDETWHVIEITPANRDRLQSCCEGIVNTVKMGTTGMAEAFFCMEMARRTLEAIYKVKVMQTQSMGVEPSLKAFTDT